MYIHLRNDKMNSKGFKGMKRDKSLIKQHMEEYKNIEGEFFVLDHEKKIAYMELEFDKPSDIFDTNAITKMPILSDDFLEWIESAFSEAPRKYWIDLRISFLDFEGYDEEQMKTIFLKNMVLEFKKNHEKARVKNHLAYSLLGIGICLFIAMMLITNLWKDGGLVKDIFAYIADITTTVTIWEAMTILVVENKERRTYMKNLLSRFSSLRFAVKKPKN